MPKPYQYPGVKIGAIAGRLAIVLCHGTRDWRDTELIERLTLRGQEAPHYSTLLRALQELQDAGLIAFTEVKRGPGSNPRHIEVLSDCPVWDELGLRPLMELGQGVAR